MGTTALMKQTFVDADWYIRAPDAYEKAAAPGSRRRPARHSTPERLWLGFAQ